jgi:hypothetical protein
VTSYGIEEPMWVSIHVFMDTTLGISLYSYLYLKLAKHHVFLIFFSKKLENKKVEQVLTGSRESKREVAQTMYTHVSKCKYYKIKNEKNGFC